MTWKTTFLHKELPASPSSINILKEASPVSLPSEYYELLAFTNGGEWELSEQPYVFIPDAVETVCASITNKEYEEFFPGFIMIGSNGAGEFISLDIRQTEPWPVVAINMTDIDLDGSVMLVTDNFQTFLGLLGIKSQELD